MKKAIMINDIYDRSLGTGPVNLYLDLVAIK